MIKVLLTVVFVSLWASLVEADPTPLFNVLDDGTGSGTAPRACVLGDSASAKNGTIAFTFRDSSGNLALPQLESTGRQQTSTWLRDINGNGVTSQDNGTQRALDCGIDVAGVQVDPRARTWTTSYTTDSVLSVPSDGTKATYSASAVGFTPGVLATDIFTITGSATKTVRVLRIEIDGTTTAGSGISANLQLIKRSTVDSGGTPVSDTAAKHDSNNAAATATVNHYTANPTLGTSAGTVRATRFSFVATGLETAGEMWEFGVRPGQAVVLRGTSEQLALNLGGVTITGGVINATVEWSEE